MGRFVFFFSEAFRALRRSAAPSVAAIVTIVITTLLLGGLVPVLHASESKVFDVREPIGLRGFLYRAATRVEKDQLQKKLNALPHVNGVEYCSPACAKQDLQSRPKGDLEGSISELNSNPLPPPLHGGPASAAPHQRQRQADADQPGHRSADRGEPRGGEQDSRGHGRG